MALSRHDIENRFMFHPVGDDRERAAKHEKARAAVKLAAHELNNLLPDGDARDQAINCLDAGLMWANAAISRGH